MNRMKKLLSIVFIVISLSSCLPETHVPMGIWQNEEWMITLYVLDCHEVNIGFWNTYPGTITVQEQNNVIFVRFSPGRSMEVFFTTLDEYGMSPSRVDFLLGRSFTV